MSDTLDELSPEEFRAAEALARRFHEAYERLAPTFSYTPRKETPVPWEQVPDNNRLPMIAVANEILRSAGGHPMSDSAVVIALRFTVSGAEPPVLPEVDELVERVRLAVGAEMQDRVDAAAYAVSDGRNMGQPERDRSCRRSSPGAGVNLSDLVHSEGYPLVVDPDPRSHRVLGDPPPDLTAAVLCEDPQGGRYIACITDAFDHLYGCAHEIAGDRYGHTHTERMLTEQARILTRWARRLADQPGDSA